MKYINKNELTDLEKSIHQIVNDVDTDNPLNVIALANTLIQIGNHILTKTSSQLITRAYSQKELEKFHKFGDIMMNPINKELYETRTAIEHYERILRENTLICADEMEDDGRPKLSQKDIENIKEKINLLKEKRNELLKQDKDYMEVI